MAGGKDASKAVGEEQLLELHPDEENGELTEEDESNTSAMACQARASDSNVSLSQTDVQLLSSAIPTLSKIDKFEDLPSQGKGKGKGKSPKRPRDDREQQHDPPAKKPVKDSSSSSSALESEETENIQALINKVVGDDSDINEEDEEEEDDILADLEKEYASEDMTDKNVTVHGKTYLNAYPLNGQKH